MEPNYYYMGLSLIRALRDCVQHSSTEHEQIPTLNESGNHVADKKCIECDTWTTWLCQTCDAAYCRNCIDKTHSEGKLMRKHVFIDSKSQQTINFYCQLHGHLPFVDFCCTCRMEMCIACTKDHSPKNHTIKSIKSVVCI